MALALWAIAECAEDSVAKALIESAFFGAEVGDPETNARIAQYEMAFRMQSSVPALTDLSKEPPSTWDLYGPEAKEPGTFAYNCLLARRMAERLSREEFSRAKSTRARSLTPLAVD